MMDEGSEIVVCQGPPSCSLEGDDAIAAMATCPFCERIYIDEFGNEETVSPSRNV